MGLQSVYRGYMECLSEHVYTTCIQHKIHTTRLYNTQIKKLWEKKNIFDWSDKRRNIYPDRVRIQFILTHKTNKVKGRRKIKTDYFINRKRSDASVTYTRWVNAKDRTDITNLVAHNVTNTNNIHEMRIYPQNLDNIHGTWRSTKCG